MRPHHRQRILLTRDADDCADWAQALAGRGYESVELPCICTELIDSAATRSRLRSSIGRADWLVFTSRRGVEALVELVPDSRHSDAQIACVGPATARAAKARIGAVALSGTGGTAASLADEIIAYVANRDGQRFVLILAENAKTVLESKLRGAGHEVHRLDAYRTIPVRPRRRKVNYSQLNCDLVFIASPTAVIGFVNQVDFDRKPAIVTIGPSSTAAAMRHGLAVKAEARNPSLDGLLEAMQCPK